MTLPAKPRRTRSAGLWSDVARLAQRAAGAGAVDAWEQYRDRPVAFFRETLGFEPWAKQVEIAEALVTHDWVTVVSGNGVGKSRIAAACGTHFLRTRAPGARVLLTAPKFGLIQEVVYREARSLVLGARVPLGFDVAMLASTGIRDEHGRQCFGWTAQDAESFQGVRSADMMVVVDEASGIDERIYEAIISLLTGGGKLLLIGNGTRSSGYFYESHKSERFARIQISALESPNVVAGRVVVPGLVTRQWVEDRARGWGVDSAPYKIRVLGQFVEAREGRLFTQETIDHAEALWEGTKAEGRLVLGVDPAGEGGDGDASAFAARRGRKVLRLHTRHGLTPDAHVVEVLGMIVECKGDSRETPVVVLDRDGTVGAKVYAALLGYLQTHANSFDLVGIRGSERAKRRPLEIDNVRDEMWFALADAFREGLAIPTSVILEGDLAAIRFDRLVNGRAKVVRKEVVRRELGRSPDVGDALCLCAFEPIDVSAFIEAQLRARPGVPEAAERVFDPYGSGGLDAYSDPYGPPRRWNDDD